MSLFHWLSHKIGSNTGHVSTWWEGDRLMVGFRCSGCGRLDGVHESVTTRELNRILPIVIHAKPES